MSQGPREEPLTVVTSTVLLEALKDPEHKTVWQQFVDRYRPLIVRYACRLGMNEVDAQDVAQLTLTAFFTSYRQGKYQREKGRLRDWLFGIARVQIRHAFTRRPHEVNITDQTSQTGFFTRVPAQDEWQDVWEQEWRAAALRRCLQQVRAELDAKTVQAFELLVHQGWPASRVAEHLDMTRNAVFIAKHRVVKRIRELLPELE